MTGYFDNALRIISDSVRSLDEAAFGRLIGDCAEAAGRGGRIIASGLGKNVPVCEKFIGTLNSLGVSAAFLHTNSAMHGDLGLVREGDVVLLLSKSGGTAETLQLLEHLERKRANVWGFSFSRDGALCKRCRNSILLELEHEGDQWDIMPNNSTAVYLIVLQGLAMQLAEKLGLTLGVFRGNHPGGKIGERLGGQAEGGAGARDGGGG
ncbi:MAG: SIS domain-containing protein [Clostridiales bacterium]|jgi:arabinose-5-phosphate isomerase|nr:SIS domain-containing protein [Clostridiales bacterium]